MSRRDPHCCAQCYAWPLKPAPGADNKPGERTCELFERPQAWNDSLACVLFNLEPDLRLRARRESYIEKNRADLQLSEQK